MDDNQRKNHKKFYKYEKNLHYNMRISNDNSSACNRSSLLLLSCSLSRLNINSLKNANVRAYTRVNTHLQKKKRETFRKWWCLATIRNCNNNRAHSTKFTMHESQSQNQFNFYTENHTTKRMDKRKSERTNERMNKQFYKNTLLDYELHYSRRL